MKDTILAVLFLGVIFVCLPLLIVWLKDRRGIIGGITRKVFGLISLFCGITLLGWFVYNQFNPTEEFKESFWNLRQLVLPILMVLLGVNWITKKDKKSNQQVEPFVTTPVDEIEPQSTQAHLKGRS